MKYGKREKILMQMSDDSLTNQKAPTCVGTLWRGGQENQTPFDVYRIEGLSILGRSHATIPSDTAPQFDGTTDQNNNNPEIVGTVSASIPSKWSQGLITIISIPPLKILSTMFNTYLSTGVERKPINGLIKKSRSFLIHNSKDMKYELGIKNHAYNNLAI